MYIALFLSTEPKTPIHPHMMARYETIEKCKDAFARYVAMVSTLSPKNIKWYNLPNGNVRGIMPDQDDCVFLMFETFNPPPAYCYLRTARVGHGVTNVFDIEPFASYKDARKAMSQKVSAIKKADKKTVTQGGVYVGQRRIFTSQCETFFDKSSYNHITGETMNVGCDSFKQQYYKKPYQLHDYEIYFDRDLESW